MCKDYIALQMFKFYYEYSDYEIRAIDCVKHRNNFHYQIYN
jgi:hypothetical protein